MTNFSLSRQTQNEEVLKNIKRQNISIDLFNKLSTLAKNLGVQTFVELIYGLPGESLKSFYDGVRSVMKQNVDGLHFFPAMLLNGSEMGTKNSRKKFDLSGEFRLIDGCSGTFGPINAIEFEEIITKTKVMTRDEYFEIRVFHFFQTKLEPEFCLYLFFLFQLYNLTPQVHFLQMLRLYRSQVYVLKN